MRVSHAAFSMALAGLATWFQSSIAQAAPETLLCIGELRTGFIIEEGKWRSAKFGVDDARLLVKPVKQHVGILGEQVNYEVYEMGSKSPLVECYRSGKSDQMLCGGLLIGMVVNFSSYRFQRFYGHGYLSGLDDGKDTPTLTIGKCSPL
jgi:hypothetical protein